MGRQPSRILGDLQSEEPQSHEDHSKAQLSTDKAERKKDAIPVQLLVLAVTDLGHVWQWSLPLETLASRAPQPMTPPEGPTGGPSGGPTKSLTAPPQPPVAPAPGVASKAATRPQLLGLLHMLPHPVRPEV